MAKKRNLKLAVELFPPAFYGANADLNGGNMFQPKPPFNSVEKE